MYVLSPQLPLTATEWGRQIKCTDVCVVARRNAALAEALGIEKTEAKVKEVEYDATVLSFYAANLVSWLARL